MESTLKLIFGLCLIIAVSADASRIVNGTDVEDGEFPFMVSIRNHTWHFCGGSILNKNYILTAAHCVCDNAIPRSTYGVSIQYKTDKISMDNYNSIPVKQIKCHAQYDLDNFLINDVALLKLEQSITGEVPKVFIPPVRTLPFSFLDVPATVIGWGYDKTNGQIATHLQKVDIRVYNKPTCESSYYGPWLNMEAHLCVGVHTNGKGSCQGDSGGPILVGNSMQVGIVSFGVGGDCGLSNAMYPKVVTNVASYAQWIFWNSLI